MPPVATALDIVQLSDTHLFADLQGQLVGLNTADTLKAVLEQVAQLSPRPDLLLLTGDLSQDESVQSYTHLRDWLAPLDIPVHWLPGNHDNLPAMAQVLLPPLCSGPAAFCLGGWQFLLLNSQVPGKVYGELSPDTLLWLENNLQAHPDQPTLIALHHPPLSISTPWLDSSRLRNPEPLLELIDRHPQVKLVSFGHIHQEFAAERRGVIYLSSPSTCVQFLPRSPQFAIDPMPPGFRRFMLYPDGQFHTEVMRVEFSYQFDLAAQGY